mmetsp:Transcript_25372/g.59781  ORF Transcript_25372/g.59781 Transcript_25372/m.59781 type:complete len:136 (-) Transcript_25372:1680-2087(-)
MCKSEETKELKEYYTEEVAKHNTEGDVWMIIGNDNNGGPKVYDVTRYLDDHPGGSEVLLDVAGQNADEFFEDIGHSTEARKELAKYLIGTYKMTEAEIEELRAKEAEAKRGFGTSNIILMSIAFALIALGWKFLN